jgi:enoyl-CoA hydratase/carnithine racemase
LSTQANLREILDYERETQTALFLGAEARAGIRAFVDKRPPDWPRQ